MDDLSQPQIQKAALLAVLDNAVDAIITINERGIIVSANPATEALFGYRNKELLGKNVKILMPDPYHQQHDGYLKNYLETGAKKIIGSGREVVGKRKDDSTFPIHLAVSEIEVEGHRLFAGIIRDITDLHHRQSRLEAILDNAVDAIITIDERGLINTTNPATEKVFGYSAAELHGQNIKMLMPAPYRDQHDGYLHNYKSTGVKKIIGIGREVMGQRKDGSTFPMHLAVSEIWIGNQRMFSGIVRDISDLKKAQSELADANERLEDRVKKRTAELRAAQADLVRSEKFATLGKVSGGIAHEIRNPLNAVKTSAYYLLNAKNATEQKVQEHLDRIDRQVTMIDNVVTALSDVAKLPDANLIPANLAPILKSALNVIGLPANVEATFETAEDLPNVLVDENQIVIAFKNLIRNARDAMPEGGTITLSADINSDTVAFHVSDTGTGIADSDIDKILEPLFTTKARGMGLGLSITRAIVEKNKGALRMESKLGQGSRFTIELNRGQ